MLRKILLISVLLVQAAFITSCSSDEPNKPDVENPNNPDDPNDPTNPDEPDKKDDLNVIVYSDGSTSNGVQFRRIDEITFMLNYVKYQIVDGHINVVGCDETEVEFTLKGNVDIVESITIDGVKYITRNIYYHAFRNCKSVRHVQVPESVVSIGYECFIGSTLETIDLPNSIKSIGKSAFKDTKLENTVIPDALIEIEDEVFANTYLRSVNLPNSIKKVGARAFKSSKLETIDLPDELTEIDDEAFGYTNLRSINLPNSIKRIGSAVFRATQLESTLIPEGVTEVGVALFYDCKNLQKVCFPSTLKTLLVTYDNYSGIFMNCDKLKSVYWLSDNPPVLRRSSDGLLLNYSSCYNFLFSYSGYSQNSQAICYYPIGCKNTYENYQDGNFFHYSGFHNRAEFDPETFKFE